MCRISLQKAEKKRMLNVDTIIELDRISFSYHHEDESEDILKDISLKVKKGEWLAIIGPNGSGKSTLVKTFNGILPVGSGQVVVDKEILTEETVWEIRKKIGMVFQNPENQFVGATVGDDVAFGLENQGVPRDEMFQRVEAALETVEMKEFINREPSSLSGGQMQRVAIAGILALNPQVIVLDEATSMLDPKARKEIMGTIRYIKEQTGMTVVSITHDIDEAAEANRIIVMKDGRIIDEGDSRHIFSKGDRLIDLGLDIPFAERLKKGLKDQNIEVPQDYMTKKELRDWLWTLDSKI